MVVLDDEHPQTVPTLRSTDRSLDMPTDYHPAVSHMAQEHATIFKQDLAHTPITDHVIDTGESSKTYLFPLCRACPPAIA